MASMKKLAAILAVLACVGVGLWYSLGPRGQTSAPRQSSAPNRPASRSSPLDLSTPAPQIRVASSVEAPPPLVVKEPAIRGWALDSHGQPLADVAICVYDIEKGPRRTFTDSAGAFAVGELDLTEYRVSAQKDHYNDAIEEKVRAPRADLTLNLTDMSTAKGRVVDEQGNPVAEFDLAYLKQPPDGEALWKEIVRSERTGWQTFKDAEGRFVVRDVASGAPFGLGARAQGFEPTFVTVPAAEPGQDTPPAEIRLKNEARISGQVLSPSRTAVAGAAIHLGPDPEGPVVAQSDAQGSFELAGLGDAAIELTASHEDFLPGTSRVVPQRGVAVPVEIVLGQGGELEGTVWRGNEPAAGQTVAALRLVPPRIRKQAVTGEDGRFRISGVGAGLVDVLAKWRGPEAEAKTLRLHQQAEIKPGMATTVDFHFPAGCAVLEGTVSANGEPVSFAEIQGNVSTPEGQSSFSSTAREDGFYHIENIVPGTAWVSFTARAGQSELRRNFMIELREGETTIQDVSFDTTSGVSGLLSNIKPGEVGQVLVLPGHINVDTSSFDSIMALNTTKSGECDIDEPGLFSIGGLDPGPYTVVALVFSGEADTGDEALNSVRVAVQSVTVGAAEEPAVTLTLTP